MKVMLKKTIEKVLNSIKTLSADLGSPSSASSVTGADAFAKINTLNSKHDIVFKTEVRTLSNADYCFLTPPEGCTHLINAYNGDWDAYSFTIKGMMRQNSYTAVFFSSNITGVIRINSIWAKI